MKLYHYHVKSPVIASIGCGELDNWPGFEEDGVHTCTAEETIEMHEHQPFFANKLTEESCDLLPYVTDTDLLNRLVLRIIPKELVVEDGALVLITEVDAPQELIPDEIKLLEEYISGQFSDGWGEGLEQRSVYDIRVGVPQLEISPADWEISIEESYTTHASVYMHVWTAEKFWMKTELINVEEVPDPEPIIRLAASRVTSKPGLGYKVTNVYQVRGTQEADDWMKRIVEENPKDIVEEDLLYVRNKIRERKGDDIVFVVFTFDGFKRTLHPKVGFWKDNLGIAWERPEEDAPTDGLMYPETELDANAFANWLVD